MENNTKSFFDGNPKMLFVFGLVCGVVITMIIGGGIPSFGSGKTITDDQVVQDDGSGDGGTLKFTARKLDGEELAFIRNTNKL